MEQCANTEALNRHMEKQESEEKVYELLLEDLRAEEDPDEWDNIIESHGWGDADHIQMLGDI